MAVAQLQRLADDVDGGSAPGFIGAQAEGGDGGVLDDEVFHFSNLHMSSMSLSLVLFLFFTYFSKK